MLEQKVEKLYYSISEVSDITDLKQYVLRYWETEFTQLRPKKNKAGNRVYKQSDIDIVLAIKKLLYTEKYTIEGARDKLKSGNNTKSSSKESDLYLKTLKQIKNDLYQLLKTLE
ncbi:MAG: transcriptional regulator [Candidatus Marinimicrobia bacterium]|nr:transcriptional regulator [Candidatus Neomarinimicrobiota bacterium]|tara:strand:+ start:92 stop:433 length:342 start_codon:yes stop_codon:yes gene_type:complete